MRRGGLQGPHRGLRLLSFDDNLRQALAKTPKLDALRQAARAAGMRNLQEEALLLVAKGVTSLQELSRALT